MKFTTIVIIKADLATLDNIRKKLPEESKVYPSDEIIKTASLLPNVDMSNNQDIAKALQELTGAKSGVDKDGIYLLETVFKDTLIEQCKKKISKPLEQLNLFDYYDIFDLQMTDDLLDSIDKYDRFPDSVVTPDFKLIRAPRVFMNIDELSPNYQDFISWKNDFKEILKKYSGDSFSLILNCHI